jgi:CubicO group peptidase (beta-lactamase class C family)
MVVVRHINQVRLLKPAFMKHQLLLTLFFSLKLVIFSFGQKPGESKTLSVPNNASALNKKLDSLFSVFNNKKSPGFAITIIKDGKVMAKKDYGMASIELNVPFNHTTVVRLPYSEGREFISIAAAIMEEQGLLSLNDKVNKYFPKLPSWSAAVSLQDLLNHSSGFCDEWATLVLTQAEMANRLDVSQFLNFLYTQPDPQVEPGKGYMYSNSDFGLLRLILEKVCGKNLSVYMTEKIFAPLGMRQTKLGRNKEEVVANHAFSYAEEDLGRYTVWMRDKTSPGGNYWILTCASDMEKWAAAHADKKSFIAKATQRLKQNARPIPVLKNGVNYVFGHKIKQLASAEVIKHEGVSGYSFLTEVPAVGLSIVCIGNNLDPYTDKTDALVRFLLNEKTTATEKRKLPTQPVPINKSEMQEYEGTYRWMHQTSFQSAVERKQFSELKVIGDSMWLLYSAVDSFPLVYVGDGIFKDPDYPVWNVMRKPHPDSAMQSTVHRQTGINDTIEWKRVTAAKKNYPIDYLQKLTGTYYSKHLDFYWRIVVDDNGQLVLKRPTIADKIIEPGYDEEFKLPIQFHTNDESWAWIKFYFTAKGEVEYLDVRHGRLMHHRFDKVSH